MTTMLGGLRDDPNAKWYLVGAAVMALIAVANFQAAIGIAVVGALVWSGVAAVRKRFF